MYLIFTPLFSLPRVSVRGPGLFYISVPVYSRETSEQVLLSQRIPRRGSRYPGRDEINWDGWVLKVLVAALWTKRMRREVIVYRWGGGRRCWVLIMRKSSLLPIYVFLSVVSWYREYIVDCGTELGPDSLNSW